MAGCWHYGRAFSWTMLINQMVGCNEIGSRGILMADGANVARGQIATKITSGMISKSLNK